jgi:Secretion system C-terminal sorting domain
MKQITLAMMAFVINGVLYSQTCNGPAICPARPENTSVTNFDWVNPLTYPYWSVNASNQTIPAVVDNPGKASTCNSSTNIFKFCSSNTPDYNPADGWRFVQQGFGTPTSGTQAPYFVIYNQFTGILRFFVATKPNNVGQVVLVSLGYSGNQKTALLETYNVENINNALDQINSEKVTPTVSNNYTVDGVRWHYADFRTTYDPCTCGFNQDLIFQVRLVNKSEIDANINLIFNATTEGSLRGEAKIAFNNGKDFLGTILGSAKDVFEGIGKIAKPNDPALNSASSNAIGITKLKALVKAFPKVAAGAAIAKAIWAVVKPSGEATGTIKFNGTLKQQTSGTLNGTLSGTLMNTQNVTSAIVRNTGAANILGGTATNTRWRSNMGVYHILNAPTIKITKIGFDGTVYGPMYPATDDWQIHIEERWMLEVPQDIKYILNPAANVCLNDLEASLIVEYADGTSEETPSFPLNCFKTMKYVLSKVKFYGHTGGTYNYMNLDFQVSKIYLHFSGVVQAPGQEVIFADRYNTKVQYFDQAASSFGEINSFIRGQATTTSGCSGFYGTASLAEIQTVCNSTAYRNNTGQLKKNQPDVTIANTFVKDDNKNARFLIAPNPVNDDLVSVTYDINEDKYVNIELFDLTGRLVKNIANGNNLKGQYQILLKTSDVPNGVYIIVLNAGGDKIQQKLVVSR